MSKKMKKLKSKLKKFSTVVKNQLCYFGYIEVEELIPEMVVSFFYSQFDDKRDAKESRRITTFYRVDDNSSPAGYMFANNDEPNGGIVTFVVYANDRNEILPYTFNFVINNIRLLYKNCTIRVCRISNSYKMGNQNKANEELNAAYKGYRCDYSFYTNLKTDGLMFAEDSRLFNHSYKWQIVRTEDGNNYSENGIINMTSLEKNLESTSIIEAFNNSVSKLLANKSFMEDKKPLSNVPSTNYVRGKTVGFNKIVIMFTDDPNKNKTIHDFLLKTIFDYKTRLGISDEKFYSRFGFAFYSLVDYKSALVKNIIIDC